MYLLQAYENIGKLSIKHWKLQWKTLGQTQTTFYYSVENLLCINFSVVVVIIDFCQKPTHSCSRTNLGIQIIYNSFTTPVVKHYSLGNPK